MSRMALLRPTLRVLRFCPTWQRGQLERLLTFTTSDPYGGMQASTTQQQPTMATVEETVPPFSLEKERYDQTCFMGRWQNTMEMTSPSNLLASDARITAALKLLKSFQVRSCASSHRLRIALLHTAPARQNRERDAPSAPPPGRAGIYGRMCTVGWLYLEC
jgi:hypothetical protein